MFGSSPKNAANTYSRLSMETGVLAADPHKLIVMLFDGAIQAVNNATLQMQNGKIPEKGKSISHAISIIESGLRASLNKEVGGDLTTNLDGLYAYMVLQLLKATLQNDPEKLKEVHTLLVDLRDAWSKIAPVTEQAKERVAAPVDALAPRRVNHFIA